jgi:hypothetical protein
LASRRELHLRKWYRGQFVKTVSPDFGHPCIKQ